MDKEYALKRFFGYDVFREGQDELVENILSGRDAMGIMPTGGGKSICYQIPALLMPGITLVISPLISLMKDQVAALKNAGVDAAYINSSLNDRQLRTVYGRLREGLYKIVYVAPERLEGSGFLALVQALDISLVAVDEAHCVSQWGQDFRPSYLKIPQFIAQLPKRPAVAAFTATATREVRRDIVSYLALQEPFCIVTGFDRPNLFFDVQKPKNKNAALENLLSERQGKSGIIYCATRTNVEKVCENLQSMGLSATRYHAGLSDGERQNNQDDFQYDRRTVMVATNAFGMGIDKSNIGFVIHYNMPKSLEAYYQEAGRAGRDGASADCILLYSDGDVSTARYMIQASNEASELDPQERGFVMQQDYKRLEAMTGYCKTAGCRRDYILDYFGQAHGTACGNCGSCRASYSLQDITTPAQMILSCVKRARDHLGYSVGASLIIRILHGGKDKRISDLRLEKLTTYGLMRNIPRPRIREYIDFLESEGYLHTNPAYQSLELTRKAYEILSGGASLEMPVRDAPVENVKAGKKSPQKAACTETAPGLMDALKALRARLAQEERVPAYVIFSNASLIDMAEKRPHNLREFLEVHGVGEKKAARYGELFVEAVSEFERG